MFICAEPTVLLLINAIINGLKSVATNIDRGYASSKRFALFHFFTCSKERGNSNP